MAQRRMMARAPRRRRRWVDNLIAQTTANSTQDSQSLIDGAVTENKGMTLVRLIIGMNIRASTGVLQSQDTQVVSMGIAAMSADAATAGAFADPNLGSDQPASGWLWRWQALVTEDVSAGLIRIEKDVRTMRKVEYGDIRLIINNDPDIGSAFSVETMGLIRALYLLP